jgi:alanine dehydrogenase
VNRATVLLTGEDVRALLPVADCIDAVENAFRRQAEAGAPATGVLALQVEGGGFHVKAATLRLSRHYFAAKLNGNFPANPAQRGLPTIQGVVALCDAEDGRLLALMDSIEITRLRTGAATAVAARYLARPESSTVLLFGCGSQADPQLRCLSHILPIRRVHLYDSDPERAESLAQRIRAELSLEASAVSADSVMKHARESDVIVTCTPSRKAFLGQAHLRPGTFVAAVGADAPDKQELEPELLAASTLVVDVVDQCAAFGELHHAVAAGVIQGPGMPAELAEVVAGSRPGRTDPNELTVFDSTGTALEDVAAAALCFARAPRSGRGLSIQLA